MERPPRALGAPFKTETVWNAGLAGTGVAEGQALVVGHDGDWAPEHLLLLAAEGSFMSTLLALAANAGVDVLGYVSNGHLEIPMDPRQPPSVLLSPCAVVASPHAARRLVELSRQAEQDSVVARVLGNRLQVTLDVQTVSSEVNADG